jgi:hypothetical protein
MSTTPTIGRSPTTNGHGGSSGPTHARVVWLVILGLVVAVAVAFAVGYAVGLGDDDGTPDAAAEQPDDEPGTDQQPDRVPADDPANESTADGPGVEDQQSDTPPEIRYAEEPRANWDVTGVATDDTLNVRGSPGVDGVVIATLRPDTAELESTGRIASVGDQLWREIIVPGDGAGWVNAAYLTETR